jgi:soluble lytic murein transglycosylase-like protein
MLRTVLAIVLLALPAAARQPLHKWVDQDGVLHVEDTPPPAAGRRSPRQSVQAPRQTDAPPDEIDKAAKLYKIPAELVRAIIWAESAGDASAVSHRGAVGLMQLMPQTAKNMYVDDSVDPRQNIQGGTRYLRTLANQFGGDMLLTVAAYNAGPDAVRKYGGVPPFEETRTYCKRVMAYYYQIKREKKQQLAQAVESRK